MKLRIGARLPVTGPLCTPENIVKVAVEAERLGFDAVTTHDHVFETRVSRYHNSGGTAELVDAREREGLSVTDIYETMTTLALVAGKTSKVRLVPCAPVLPWRHPVLFAKETVTLHNLSGGRFVCPVVVGNITSDFEAMNVDFHKRGRMMDEYLEVLSLLVTSKGPVTYDGRYIKLKDCSLDPKPTTKLPIWIGGSWNEKVFERIAKFGDGIIGGGGPDMCREGVEKLGQSLRLHGRTLDGVEVGVQTFMCLMQNSEDAISRAKYTVESFYHGAEWANQDLRKIASAMNDALIGSPAEVVRRLERFAKAGVSFFDVRMVNRSMDDVLAMMRQFSKDILPSFS